MNEKLIELIKRFEGCKLEAYRCPAGIWTCGWGSTGIDIKEGTHWTQSEADNRMVSDAESFLKAAGTMSPLLLLPENSNKLAAIADFCYNLGAGKYKSSTLKVKVDAGDWDAAIVEIQKWVFGGGNKLPGLVARRKAEAELFI